MMLQAMRRRWLVAGLLLVSGCLDVSARPVQIRTGADGRATAISNLVPREDCFPGHVKGLVSKRHFGQPGTTFVGVTVKEANGVGTFVNLDSDFARGDGAMAVDIKAALDTLLAVGKRVDLGVYGCGASGSVMRVHSIKSI